MFKTKNFFFLFVFPLTFLGQPASCEQWYSSLPSDEKFLLGDWVSLDAKSPYKESWKNSSGKTTYCVRTEGEGNGFTKPLFTVISFSNTPWGRLVRMRQLNCRLEDSPFTKILYGNWTQNKAHRGQLEFRNSDGLIIVMSYDSPSSNFLNVKIVTTQKKQHSEKTYHLKRQEADLVE